MYNKKVSSLLFEGGGEESKISYKALLLVCSVRRERSKGQCSVFVLQRGERARYLQDWGNRSLHIIPKFVSFLWI